MVRILLLFSELCLIFPFVEQWRNKIKDFTQYFKDQEDSKANESLRPGGARAADDLFGMDGTFRQLSID